MKIFKMESGLKNNIGINYKTFIIIVTDLEVIGFKYPETKTVTLHNYARIDEKNIINSLTKGLCEKVNVNIKNVSQFTGKSELKFYTEKTRTIGEHYTERKETTRSSFSCHWHDYMKQIEIQKIDTII